MAKSSAEIDLIFQDSTTKEWALYLVEEGPWLEEELEVTSLQES